MKQKAFNSPVRVERIADPSSPKGLECYFAGASLANFLKKILIIHQSNNQHPSPGSANRCYFGMFSLTWSLLIRRTLIIHMFVAHGRTYKVSLHDSFRTGKSGGPFETWKTWNPSPLLCRRYVSISMFYHIEYNRYVLLLTYTFKKSHGMETYADIRSIKWCISSISWWLSCLDMIYIYMYMLVYKYNVNIM